MVQKKISPCLKFLPNFCQTKWPARAQPIGPDGTCVTKLSSINFARPCKFPGIFFGYHPSPLFEDVTCESSLVVPPRLRRDDEGPSAAAAAPAAAEGREGRVAGPGVAAAPDVRPLPVWQMGKYMFHVKTLIV